MEVWRLPCLELSSYKLKRSLDHDAAVLVETGFISNTGDRNILKNQSTQVGIQVARGIMNHLKVGIPRAKLPVIPKLSN